MSKKLPAMQFYPGDWRKDVGVQSLTFHDRGVWHEILMLMHESESRGLLILNGLKMSDEVLARVLGMDNQILTITITNLIACGVASFDEDTGALMCRRMCRDERVRQVRTECGKKGGRPRLVGQNESKREASEKQNEKQNISPSSSFSSSPSVNTAQAALRSFDEDEEGFTPSMAASAVMQKCAISGKYLPGILTDVFKAELSQGKSLAPIIAAMEAAWIEHQTAKPKLQFPPGAEKFFGEGTWKNKAAWVWKPGMEPAVSRRYVNAQVANA